MKNQEIDQNAKMFVLANASVDGECLRLGLLKTGRFRLMLFSGQSKPVKVWTFAKMGDLTEILAKSRYCLERLRLTDLLTKNLTRRMQKTSVQDVLRRGRPISPELRQMEASQ